MRYFHGHSEFPSKEDIEADPDLSPPKHSLDEPIDYEKLKSAIEELGPIQMTREKERLKMVLNITPCQICAEPCNDDVISLIKVSGATSLTTLISRNRLLAAKTLDGFFEDFLHNPFLYFSASAECQTIEHEIKRHLGFDPLEVFHGKVDARDVKGKLSSEYAEDFWKAHALQSIYRTLLVNRLEIGHFSSDDFFEQIDEKFEKSADFTVFLRQIFDFGFLSARLISEHFIRSDLEPFVAKGEAAAATQERRNKGNGEAANKKRHLRVTAMLDRIEALLKDNPAFSRLDIRSVADIAIEDAAKAQPELWTQGRGLREPYGLAMLGGLPARELCVSWKISLTRGKFGERIVLLSFSWSTPFTFLRPIPAGIHQPCCCTSSSLRAQTW